MTRKKLVIDDIAFEADELTVVPLNRLFAWVVWQFPRPREDGFNGAVHPPEADHGWYPAIINSAKGNAKIFGHVKEPYPTPEAAAKQLEKFRN